MLLYLSKPVKTLNPLRLFAFNGVFWLFTFGAHAVGMTPEQAEQLALQFDPLLKAQAWQLRAIENETVAVEAWEDPQLRIGVIDVPADSFDINADVMTTLELGYQQMLPRGDTTALMARKKQAQQQQQQAVIQLRQREIKKLTRQAWLDIYAQQQTEIILHASRKLFAQQLDVSQSLYAVGRSNQQEVLQAELELSLVDDRLQKVQAMQREKAAAMAQLIGDVASQQAVDANAELFIALSAENSLREQLRAHPTLQQQQFIIAAQSEDVELAKQKYKPQWGFDLSYERSDEGRIGSVDASYMSAMLLFDLPVFTGKLQDREYAASQHLLQAERYAGQDVLLQLTSQLQQNLSRWQQLTQRLKLYDERVLNQARQNAQVALKGYQAGVVSFEAMARARSSELDAQMQRLDLYVEKAMVYAQILYLTAE